MQVEEALSKLVRWRHEWEQRSLHVITERHASEGSPPFQSVLWFESIQQASEILLYNGTMTSYLFLAKFLQDPMLLGAVLGDSAKSGKSHGPLILPDASVTLGDPADEACCCIEYCLQEGHAQFGSFQAAPVLRLV
jgi:hypothetical protein